MLAVLVIAYVVVDALGFDWSWLAGWGVDGFELVTGALCILRAADLEHRRARSSSLSRMQVTASVNSREYTRDVEPRMLLLHFLRDELGLTGTHWGCDTSNCGTCVVLIDGEPVKSCTMLAATAEGASRSVASAVSTA